MNKYETIKADMTAALKSGDKLRRLTLADMVATIDKAAIAGKTRVEITDAFVDDIRRLSRKWLIPAPTLKSTQLPRLNI